MDMTENDIVIANMGLINWLVNSLLNWCMYYGLEFDDVKQTACIGFLKAIRRYKNGRGSFSNFAVHCMKQEIINLVRYKKRLCRNAVCLSLDAPLRDGSGLTLCDLIPYEQDFSEVEIRDILDRMPDKQREAINRVLAAC